MRIAKPIGSIFHRRWRTAGSAEKRILVGLWLLIAMALTWPASRMWAGSLEVGVDFASPATSYGLRVWLTSTCTAVDQDLVLDAGTAFGDYEACRTVTAGETPIAVQVVSPGATFRAGERIILRSDFSVASGASLTAAIESDWTPFAYVRDASPTNEVTYNASFQLNIDNLLLGDADRLEHFIGLSSVGPQFRVVLKRNAVLSDDRLVLEARLDNGAWVDTSSLGKEKSLAAGWNRIELSWRSGAGNGQFLVSVNGAGFDGLTGLDNDQARIDEVEWGAIGGNLVATTGSLDLDEFASWR